MQFKVPCQSTMEPQQDTWLYKEKVNTLAQRVFTCFSTLWCITKKEKCSRCLETIRPIEGSSNGGCNPNELHMTCACFLEGDYFLTDAQQSTLWRDPPEKQIERHIENFCCLRAAAIGILPSSALEDINEVLSKTCECQHAMYSCNASCCGSTSPCMKMLLQLCTNYQLQGITLTDEQYNALKIIVNTPWKLNKK